MQSQFKRQALGEALPNLLQKRRLSPCFPLLRTPALPPRRCIYPPAHLHARPPAISRNTEDKDRIWSPALPQSLRQCLALNQTVEQMEKKVPYHFLKNLPSGYSTSVVSNNFSPLDIFVSIQTALFQKSFVAIKTPVSLVLCPCYLSGTKSHLSSLFSFHSPFPHLPLSSALLAPTTPRHCSPQASP